MLAYLIRHAESTSNLEQTDSLNSRLSDLGRRQSDALAARLRSAAPEAIYCSPYQRCLDTAAPLAAGTGLPIRVRPDLCEFHYLPPGAIRSTELPALAGLVESNPGVEGCPDWNAAFEWPTVDEPLDALLQRTRGFADELKSRWTGDESVVVISHGSPIARLLDAWMTVERGPSFRFIIDNAAISAVRHYEGVSSLICLNDVSHLAGLPAPAAANYRDDGTLRAVPPTPYW